MTRIILPFFSFLFFASIGHSQTIYLKYESDCMDRMEYASEKEEAAYISYRFDLGRGKIAHFDVGKEQVKWVRDLPGKVTYCNNLTVDKDLIRKINMGAVSIYMVRESPTHYNVSPVEKAAYIDNYGTGLEVVMGDAEFVLEMNNLVSNRNLAKPSSPLAVFLDGTIQYKCAKGYIFKKMENFNSSSYKEYIMIPELGIVEKRSVAKVPLQSSSRTMSPLKLNKIEDKGFTDALIEICDALQASYYDKDVITNPTPPQPGGQVAKGGGEPAVPTSYENYPCGMAPRDGVHFVQKGETLYSISKRYGVTLDQIRAWNNLGSSNTIGICQALNVKSPTRPPSGTTSPAGGASTTPKGGEDGYWVRNAEVHIVRPGESVAALAKMYGYTEDRFRRMNNLGTYERIYAGQSLHTSDCACPTLESSTVGAPLPYEAVTETLTTKGNPDVYFKPIRVHQVGKGESLFSVATQYDTTVDRISELNGLAKNAKLLVGQRLYVQ